MKSVEQRVKRLEDRFVPPDGPFLIVVTGAAQILALDQDACVQILKEAGFIGRSGMYSAELTQIPDGLNAAELKQYLLENGHDIVPQSRPRA